MMVDNVQQTIVVTYENDEHRRYADLCGRFGFDLTIGSDLKVGLEFIHPTKLHIVKLEKEDDAVGWIYDPKLFVNISQKKGYICCNPSDYTVPMHPEFYSDIEWKFIVGNDNDDPIVVLERELQIWINIRPHSLNTMKIIG